MSNSRVGQSREINTRAERDKGENGSISIVRDGHLLLEEPDQPDPQLGRVVPPQHVAHEKDFDLQLDLKMGQSMIEQRGCGVRWQGVSDVS